MQSTDKSVFTNEQFRKRVWAYFFLRRIFKFKKKCRT